MKTSTLRAEPKSTFSSDLRIFRGDEEIGLLDLRAMREAATLHLGDESFELSREGMMSGAFFLARGEEAIVKAEKPSAFRSEFEIQMGDQTIVLMQPSVWKTAYELRMGDAVIGRIDKAGRLSRKATIELPADWPLPLQLFVFWLVQLMWNRGDAATAAT